MQINLRGPALRYSDLSEPPLGLGPDPSSPKKIYTFKKKFSCYNWSFISSLQIKIKDHKKYGDYYF